MIKYKILAGYAATWMIWNFTWVAAAFYLGSNSSDQQAAYVVLSLIIWFTALAVATLILTRWTRPLDSCLGLISKGKKISDEELKIAAARSLNLPLYGWALYTIMWIACSSLAYILLRMYGPFGPRALYAIWVGGLAGILPCPPMALAVFGLIFSQASRPLSLELEKRKLKIKGTRINLLTKWSLSFIGIAIGYGIWMGGLGYYTGVNQLIEEVKSSQPIIQKTIIDNIKFKIGENITVENLKPMINEIRLGKEGFAFLADSQGNIIYNPKQEEIFVERWADINNSLVAGIKSGQPGSIYENAGERIISYSPINGEYILGAVSYLKEKAPRLNIYLIWLIVFMLGAIIVVVTDVAALAAWVTGSIAGVSSVLRKVIAGDFSKRVPTESQDEIGDLAADCNVMTMALEDYKEKLEISKTEIENIIQSQTDLVFVVDTKGIILRANQAVLNILGYRADEIIGKPATMISHPDTREKDIAVGPKKAIGGGIVANTELVLRHKNGRKLPFSFNGTPLKDAQGKIIGAIGVGRDLREIRKLINQLEKTKVSLEEQVKDRTKELENKLGELERFNKLAVGRELKMIELKEEIKKLSDIKDKK